MDKMKLFSKNSMETFAVNVTCTLCDEGLSKEDAEVFVSLRMSYKSLTNFISFQCRMEVVIQ